MNKKTIRTNPKTEVWTLDLGLEFDNSGFLSQKVQETTKPPDSVSKLMMMLQIKSKRSQTWEPL